MGRLLFFFLSLLKIYHKILLKIKGCSEEEFYSRRVVTGKSWEDFCDNLKAAGSSLLYQGTPRDAFQQAEGLRYLSRLTRGGLEAFVEFNDPAFPVFRQIASETIKLGADNPDNIYLNASISAGYEYIITGTRNTINYIGFFTQNGSYGKTGGLSPCGRLDDNEIIYGEDGSFDIIVSKEKKGRNWLKMDDQTTMVMIRQTFFNRSAEKAAEVHIRNTAGPLFPQPLSPSEIDQGLANAALFVGGASLLFAKWANGFKKHTNTLPLFDPEVSNAAGGDPGIFYYHSHWKLAHDEALIIVAEPPGCESWNFQLNNYWMESLDYRYFGICINKSGAVYEQNGSVKIVVCADDPGMPNWINTSYHNEGTMLWRWYRLTAGEKPVEPLCKVVKLQEIKKLK